ncbi:glutathione S-transferase [Rubellimicrobium aerolatum]|uniref:Glutathione S-transferase n=1 Tax=Rubellimicrobium aerolatum TaxID=490979 RepID=A0ABW0S8T7_9RHOB|nr:glutathione S-transferase [Rubellimicrobium aerolatum]MBP1804711.1 glutathione S-transferase [Rubellimicrobium aerolatum]
MTYDLAIGDRAYSSWSLRGWLLLDAFGLPVRTHSARLYTDELPTLLKDFAPARTVPALRLPDGTVVLESLAIAEELASRHPDAGHWPADSRARAVARSLAAEMHAGFHALRSQCPMNIRVSYETTPVDDALRADLDRLETLWSWARETTGSPGPWLCGPYSAADAFFAPVATRIATYALPVSPSAQATVAAHLSHPSFRRWRAMALVDGPDQEFYRRDHPRRPWPGPAPLPARAVEAGTPENAACPYSGQPVTHLLESEGRTIGFCNALCRDKTVADPLAWPAFAALWAAR